MLSMTASIAGIIILIIAGIQLTAHEGAISRYLLIINAALVCVALGIIATTATLLIANGQKPDEQRFSLATAARIEMLKSRQGMTFEYWKREYDNLEPIERSQTAKKAFEKMRTLAKSHEDWAIVKEMTTI